MTQSWTDLSDPDLLSDSRLQIENNFDSLVSAFSGSSIPSPAAPGQLWLDTSSTPNILKMRGQSTWVEVGRIDATASPTITHLGHLDLRGSSISNNQMLGELLLENTITLPTDTNAAVQKKFIMVTSGTNAMLAPLDFGGHKGINVTDPSAAQDAATKNYVDTNTGLLKVEDYNPGSLFSSKTFTGLDGNTDIIYKVIIEAKNNTGGNVNYQISFNPSGTVLGPYQINSTVVPTSQIIFCMIDIFARRAQFSGDNRIFGHTTLSRHTVADVLEHKTFAGVPAANITEIKIDSATSNAFEAGSRISLYKQTP